MTLDKQEADYAADVAGYSDRKLAEEHAAMLAGLSYQYRIPHGYPTPFYQAARIIEAELRLRGLGHDGRPLAAVNVTALVD